MKHGLLAGLVVVALGWGAAAPRAWAAELPAPASVMGAWAVDVARLPMPPQARPQKVTITFSPVGSAQVRMQVEVVDPAGQRLVADGVTPLDGTPTPVASNFEADVSATTMPRPEVLVMQLGKNGIPASTRIYVVAADGRTMEETVAYFGPNGQPVMRRNYFSRLP